MKFWLDEPQARLIRFTSQALRRGQSGGLQVTLALSLALPQLRRDPKMLGSLSDIVGQQGRVLIRQGDLRCFGLEPESVDHFCRHRSRKWWWNRKTDLSRAMPFRGMEAEPIWKAVKSRHFANCDAP